MKLIFLSGIFVFSALYLPAQIHAITDTGAEVILHQDGTWEYAKGKGEEVIDIKISEKEFKKNESSTFLVKSTKVDIGIYIDPKKWTFSKGKDNPDAEFEFQRKGEDLYGMLIAEKMEIPVTTLRGIAIDNAKISAPDIRVIKEEYRMVNGIKVLLLHMEGTISGLKFLYYGYYYSNSSGTIQLLTYTAQNLLSEYQVDIEEFLNGFVEL